MSDQSDDADHVIMASDDLAIEETISSRTRSRLSNNSNCRSPKISTPKSCNVNKTTNSDKVKKSNIRRSSNNNRLEERFPEISAIFEYKKNSRMEVIDLLKRNNDNDTNVIYINSESISAEKLYELCDRDIWLSSDHINAYLSYLNTKFHSIFSLPSFFYTKLTTTGRYDYSSVVRWTKKTEIFNKEIIFVPINLDETHWILATIFMKDEYRIAVLDSLGILTNDNAIAIGSHLIRWLNDEYCHKFRVYDNNEYENPDLNESIRKSTIFGDAEEISFTFDIMFREKPPQVDGCSCGVFVCMFARLIAENVERDTIMEIAKWQEAILKFRKVMCTDLWEYAKANGQVDKVKIVDNIFSP